MSFPFGVGSLLSFFTAKHISFFNVFNFFQRMTCMFAYNKTKQERCDRKNSSFILQKCEEGDDIHRMKILQFFLDH